MFGKRKHLSARELRFETVILKKVQKNLDNYIYIYIYLRRFLRNKGRAYNTVCQPHKTSFRQRGENTSPSGLASG